MDDVQPRLVELGGGDRFHVVLEQAQQHQQTHGCRLFPAGPAVMQLASMFVARPTRNPPGPRVGIGYSTFWLAQGAGPDATVTGIDSDAGHIEQARQLCTNFGLDGPVDFVLGEVTDVLADTPGPVDAIHDDAWFATPPAHLEAMLGLLRPGGLLTMPNWFLLIGG